MKEKIISFSIFENGENLSEIKSRAIDKMKSIKNISETEALDIVSKEINKLPFEKAFFKAKDESPFTIGGVILCPIFHDSEKFLVMINEKGVYLSSEQFFLFPDNIKIQKPSYKVLKKTETGWTIDLLVKSYYDSAYVEIKKTEDDIVVELIYLEMEEKSTDTTSDHIYSHNVLRSAWAFFNEIFYVDDMYNHINFESREFISSGLLGYQFGHKSDDDTTTLASYDEYFICLKGSIGIKSPKNNVYFGAGCEIILDNPLITNEDFINFLEGKKTLSMRNYEIISKPYFEIRSKKDDSILFKLDKLTKHKKDIFKNLFYSDTFNSRYN